MLTIHAVGNTHAETRANPVSTKATGRRGEFDYLRGFVIVASGSSCTTNHNQQNDFGFTVRLAIDENWEKN